MKPGPTRRLHSAPTRSDPVYSLIAESVPHMVFTAEPDGSIDFRNRAILEYTGSGATGGWKWVDVVHPDDRESSLRLWRAALGAGTPFEHESRLRRHDGAYRWHRCVARPLRNAAGSIVLWVGTATDIDVRRREMEALALGREAFQRLALENTRELRASEARFRQFMARLPAVAWIKDAAFRFRWVNARYLEVHSRRVEDLRGRDDFALWPAQIARRLRAEDEAVARGNADLRARRTVTLRGGARREYLILKFPIPLRGGGPGIAGLGFDLDAQPRFDAPVRAGDVRPSQPAAEGKPGGPDLLGRLSPRERQVLRLIVEGCTNTEAAERLNLSPKSVETYRSRVLSKLEIGNLPALVKFAIRHGLTTID